MKDVARLGRGVSEGAAEGPEIAAGQVEADLGAGLLFGEAVPGHPLDLGEADLEDLLGLGLIACYGAEDDDFAVSLGQAPAVG